MELSFIPTYKEKIMIEILKSSSGVDSTDINMGAFNELITSKFYKTSDNRFYTSSPIFYNVDSLSNNLDLGEEEKFIIKTIYRCVELYAIAFEPRTDKIYKVPVRKLYHVYQNYASIIRPSDNRELVRARIDGVLIELRSFGKPKAEEFSVRKYEELVNSKHELPFIKMIEELQAALNDDLNYMIENIIRREKQ